MKVTIPGMEAFRKTLIKSLKSDIPVVTLDVGFNDPSYAETILQLFDEMMPRLTVH
jgi:hypothetical protein